MADAPNEPQAAAGDDVIDPQLVAAMEAVESRRAPRPKVATEPVAEVEGDPSDDAETTEPEKAAEPPVVDDEAALKAAAEKDPAVKRGAEMLAKAEQRQREKLETERKGWEERLAKAAEIEERLASVAADPIAALEAAGYTDDDFHALAVRAYKRRLGDKVSPEFAAHAREIEEKVTSKSEVRSLRDEIEALKKERAEERRQAEIAKKVEAWRGTVRSDLANVSEATSPFVAHFVKVRAADVQEDLDRIGDAFEQEHGQRPTLAEILPDYEKALAAKFGADYLDYLKTKKQRGDQPAQQKQPAQSADERATAPRTLTQRDAASPSKPRSQAQYQDRSAEMLAFLDEADRAARGV